MASISKEPNGHRTIQFIAGDGKRRSIRLGKAPQKTAQTIKGHVEALNVAAISGTTLERETAVWLSEIDYSLREKLANVGLVEQRKRVVLGKFIAAYIAGRTDAKPNTIKKWRTTEESLVAHFGAETLISEIAQGAVDEWRRTLAKDRAENTVRKYIAIAKVFFNAAVRQRLIDASPFSDQKASILPNDSRAHFVGREDAEKVLEACPDAEWRLIFALARYGGLRTPSETLALRWEDVDLVNHRIRVKSSKTEHHVGKGFRFVPIFSELRPYLEDAQELAAPGSEYVITRYRDSNVNLRTQLLRIIDRAGLKAWPKVFQNLRSTRQTELEADFPLHVVCSWLGNSERVARRHYLQVTDAHFAKAVTDRALQNPVQQPTASDRNAALVQRAGDENLEENATCGELCAASVAEAGLEPARELPPTGF